jgi:hypothetical protein
MKSIEENDAKIFHKKIDQDRIMVIQVRDEYFVISIFFDSYRQLLYE